MKTLLLIASFLLVTGHLIGNEITPDASGTPIFQVCAVTTLPDAPDANSSDHSKPQVPRLGVDTAHPLLSVYWLRDFLLEPDKKGVRIVLTESDSKVMEKLTFDHDLLCFVGTPTEMVIIKTNRVISDGSITFEDAHHTGAMATYLRRRFHIKPDSNEEESPIAPKQSPPPIPHHNT